MLIPLGTDRPLRHRTVVTWALIMVNVVMFVAQVLTGLSGPDATGMRWRQGALEEKLALRRAAMFVLEPDMTDSEVDPGIDTSGSMALRETSRSERAGWEYFHWWALFTYAFLHASWWHLAGNMLFLWVFGPNIEDRFGRLGFLIFYLLGAAAAGALQILIEPTVGVVGASGAIAACTGAYLIMFPRAMVRAFSLLFVLGMVTLPAWWFIGFSIVWDLVAQGSGSLTGVAHLAHLGGYLYGGSIAFALLGLRLLPREPYDVFSMTRQAYRRQQLRSAVTTSSRAHDRKWERAKATPPPNSRAAEQAARSDALAAARAEISKLMGREDLAGAAVAYKQFADQFESADGGMTLSRRHQYALANHFFATGDHAAALYAYERFLETYPRDPEAPQIRLLLGRLNARYLNDPVRAKALITEAMAGLRDEESRAMAKKELEALG